MGFRAAVTGIFVLPLLAVACGVGMSEAAAPVGVTPRDEWTAQAYPAASSPTTDGGDCPYGRLEDPHRGFVRCLEPGEADAGKAFPAPEPEPTDAGVADAPVDGPNELPPADGGGVEVRVKPEIEISPPSFENGEVPKTEKFLASNVREMAACIADHGGLSGKRGKIKLQFLVRARGRAEGVGVLSSTGVTDEAAACIVERLKNRMVGAPSADPVGVTVTLQLKAP